MKDIDKKDYWTTQKLKRSTIIKVQLIGNKTETFDDVLNRILEERKK